MMSPRRCSHSAPTTDYVQTMQDGMGVIQMMMDRMPSPAPVPLAATK